MAGLIDRMNRAEGGGQAPAPAGGPAPAPERREAGEVEQLQRSTLMKAAGGHLYSDEGLERTVSALAGGGDPMENAARVTALLMHALARNAEAKGKRLNDDALLDAGREVLERVVAIGVDIGVIDPQQAKAGLDQAGEQALAMYESMTTNQGGGEQPAAGGGAGAGMAPGAPPAAPAGRPGGA